MFRVLSKDGTSIAGSVGGEGTPVALVHGTCGSDFSWALVRPHLELRHTAYAVQRRGRGESGDGPHYALAREAEDVAAVVDSLGARAGLVGHSFGANCALEASLLTTNLSWLVLYEPVFAQPVDERNLARIDSFVAAGMAEAAVETYLVEVVGLNRDELNMLRGSPTWKTRASAAHTVSREDRASAAYTVVPRRFAGMKVPTLLLAGSESPPEFRKSVDDVHAALPESSLHVLEGHGHAATLTAPELVAREIIEFGRQHGSGS